MEAVIDASASTLTDITVMDHSDRDEDGGYIWSQDGIDHTWGFGVTSYAGYPYSIHGSVITQFYDEDEFGDLIKDQDSEPRVKVQLYQRGEWMPIAEGYFTESSLGYPVAQFEPTLYNFIQLLNRRVLPVKFINLPEPMAEVDLDKEAHEHEKGQEAAESRSEDSAARSTVRHIERRHGRLGEGASCHDVQASAFGGEAGSADLSADGGAR